MTPSGHIPALDEPFLPLPAKACLRFGSRLYCALRPGFQQQHGVRCSFYAWQHACSKAQELVLQEVAEGEVGPSLPQAVVTVSATEGTGVAQLNQELRVLLE